MPSRLAGTHLPWRTAILTGLALTIHFVPGLAALAEFDPRQATEAWRLFTCHLAHFDARHLFYSGSMLVLLGAIAERRDPRRMVACVAIAALLIPLAFGLWPDGLTHYRGASGLDSALFCMLITTTARDARRDGQAAYATACALLGALFLVKIGYELLTGHAAFADSPNFVPVPIAHLVGGGIGLGVGLSRRPPNAAPAPTTTTTARPDAGLPRHRSSA